MENLQEFPQKIKSGTASWPSDSTSRNTQVSGKNWNTDSKEYMNLYGHRSIIYNCQDLEAAQMAIGRWVYKKCGTFTQ